jgi:protein gp37
MFLRENAWWHPPLWNTLFGCLPAPGSIICEDCWSAGWAGKLHAAHDVESYRGTTIRTKDGHFVFNGTAFVLADGDERWTWPLRDDWFGYGAPALIAVNLTGDTFFEGHSIEDIARTIAIIVLSDHIGLFLTRRQRRMRDYVLAQSPLTIAGWIPKTWWGVSACTQAEFELRWPDLYEIARLGFTVFVSLAPLVEPIRLPPELLALGNRAWVIVNGMEKVPHERCRDTDPDWMRAVRDQCAGAGVPIYVKGMSFRDPIPIDLLIRQFPAVRR